MGGMVLETNMNEIVAQIEAQNRLEKSEVSPQPGLEGAMHMCWWWGLLGSVLESVDVKLSPASSAGKEVSGLRLGARRVSRRGRWLRKACGPPKLYISLEGPSSPCSRLPGWCAF